MKRSELHFSIELDDKNIPDKIFWLATDNNPEEKINETKGIAVSIWDHESKNTMKLDLWTKEMQVDEMKKFCIETLVGMGETVRGATGDEFMANEIAALAKKLRKHHETELGIAQ
jgi:gliding motility-associated protein GldC